MNLSDIILGMEVVVPGYGVGRVVRLNDPASQSQTVKVVPYALNATGRLVPQILDFHHTDLQPWPMPPKESQNG